LRSIKIKDGKFDKVGIIERKDLSRKMSDYEGDTGSEDSRGGKGDGGRGGGRDNEQELDSKTLQIGQKRFYIDVKQNWRGRYIKIAEVMLGGRKSRVLVSMPAAVELRNQLTAFAAFADTLKDKPAKDEERDAPPLKTFEIKSPSDERTYTMDMRQNKRGRYVRIGMRMAPGSMDRAARGIRSAVAIPDNGLKEVKDALAAMIEKWNKDLPPDTSYKGPMPEVAQMRVGPKTFYFDYGQNSRGVFMRVSEVKARYRTAITIPAHSWTKFREVFEEACKTVPEDIRADKKANDAGAVKAPNAK
jgi:hypothetical protein